MKAIQFFITLIGCFAAVPCVSAQNQTVDKVSLFNVPSGLAIKGYDPVAYFAEGKAVEGLKEYTVTVDGIIYRFSSSRNRDLFTANPGIYKPQYGGWCAYAMGATGDKVDIDPETFKIINGKLYLFYNRFFNNTLKSWNKDEINLKNRADANWAKLNQIKP